MNDFTITLEAPDYPTFEPLASPSLSAREKFGGAIVTGVTVVLGWGVDVLTSGIERGSTLSSLSPEALRMTSATFKVTGGAAATTTGLIAGSLVSGDEITLGQTIEASLIAGATIFGSPLTGAFVAAAFEVMKIESYNVSGPYNGTGLTSTRYGSAIIPGEFANTNGMGAEIQIGYEWSALDQIAYETSQAVHATSQGRYGYNVDGVYVDQFPSTSPFTGTSGRPTLEIDSGHVDTSSFGGDSGRPESIGKPSPGDKARPFSKTDGWELIEPPVNGPFGPGSPIGIPVPIGPGQSPVLVQPVLTYGSIVPPGPIDFSNPAMGAWPIGNNLLTPAVSTYVAPRISYAPTVSPIPTLNPWHEYGGFEAVNTFNKNWNTDKHNPPGTKKVPNGLGFSWKNLDGSDWEPGNGPDYSASSAYDDKGKPQREGGGYGGKESTWSKDEWDEAFDNLGDPINKPIILDLDGDGIELTELSKSTRFVDATGDGLLNRTAWAGAGDGVLFYDANGDGTISEKREYVFTEWDPTATSDMEALASVFDSNGDGVFDANDDAWVDFKVLVTNEDGSYTAKTLDEIGITSIDLTADATNIELPDGSVITGKTTFTKSDGSTGTVADTTLVAESAGHRVEKDISTNAAGNRVEVSTGYNADGSIAFVLTAETSPDGLMITNSLDRNGDGVVDVIQTIATVVNADDSKVETVTNKSGADAATAVLTSQTVTSTSADKLVVTIQRDSLGGGWFDQVETRTTHAVNKSMTIVVTDLSSDGSTIRQVTETVSADGMTRSEAIDHDGDGDIDLTINHVIVVNGDGSRSETITHLNNDGSTRSAVTETVSADGKVKTIARDVDGDGDTDTLEETSITVNADGSTSSVVNVKNGDGSLRSSVAQDQSADALTKTTTSDVDGDGDIDLTTVDQTVINADGSRVQTVTATNTDGSVNGMSKTTLDADKVTSQTWVDLNQNGVFEATDLVQDVSVNAVSGERTAVSYSRNADGTVNTTQTSVTAADGLTTITTIDADGDGDTDSTINDVTVNNADGSTTRTVTTRNGDNSLRSEVTTVTSADGLTTTVETDRDGDGQRDSKVMTVTVVNADGSTTTTTDSFAGNGITLLSRSVTEVSADRKTSTTTTDSNGDGHSDQIVTSTTGDNGNQSVVTQLLAADGSQTSRTTTWRRADGLSETTRHWLGETSIREFVAREVTTLLNSGSVRLVNKVTTDDDSNVSWQQVTISDDGLVQTTEVDADWDGVKERTTTATTVLNADGSAVTTTEVENANGQVMSRSQSETSDDGLTQITRSDADGDGDYDLVTTSTTTLLNDGGRSTVTELHELDGTLRSSTTSTISDDGRQSTVLQDVNGDGNIDSQVTRSVGDDGVVTEISSHFDSTGNLQSRTQNITSANGLHVTSSVDADGNGVFEMTSESLTVLNTDGSRTTTLSEKSADGSIWRQTVTTISADGLTKTTATDLDFNGTADFTTTVSSSLAADGVETISTTTTSADGTVISTGSEVISADQRTITTYSDLDGNGHNDIVTVTTISDDGTAHTNTNYLSSLGHDWASAQSSVSGDGQTRISRHDTDGDGYSDLTVISERSIEQNGITTTTTESFNEHMQSIGSSHVRTNANGLYQTADLDLDGDGVADYRTTSRTTFLENGDTIQTSKTSSETMDVISGVEHVVSGDGLRTRTSIDLDGDGIDDRRTDTQLTAEGAAETRVKLYDNAFNLQEQVLTTVSADGRTTTIVADTDGDGENDYLTEVQEDLSGNVTTTMTDFGDHGTTDSIVSRTVSANGMNAETTVDTDGDGSADLRYVSEQTYDASGNTVTTYSEYAGTSLTYQKISTTSADGLNSTASFDMDGDGVTDGTASSTTSINGNGSTSTIDETHYVDGELRSSSSTETSADGRATVQTDDYDGNSIADRVISTETLGNGVTVETITTYNEGGNKLSTFVTETSANGLETKMYRDDAIQTITRSAVSEESYTWDNGIEFGLNSTNLNVAHEVDAAGIETWTMVRSVRVTETYTHEKNNGDSETRTRQVDRITTETARLDATTKAEILAEAARLYDTILDRDMDFEEIELLVQYIDGNTLNSQMLAGRLVAQAEFSTRYGSSTNAEFIIQIYLNSYGRAPALQELMGGLEGLADGSYTRATYAVDRAESSEHIATGNWHMRTNNLDVIMNPAQFERSLDRAWVDAKIRNLVDTVFDRDATETEIALMREWFMEGSDTDADVVAKLLLADDGAFGESNASLADLDGSDLVSQAFLNAFNRVPSYEELTTWSGLLQQGLLSKEQFIASLAQSTEHLEVGNLHQNSGHTAGQILSGTIGNETLNGTDFDDHLLGHGGVDKLYGKDGDDVITGGTGDDMLYGGRSSSESANGNDTYVWSKGDGNDTIYDAGRSVAEVDRLVLTDVTPDDIALTRANGSYDLIITVLSTGEVITDRHQYSSPSEGGRGLEVIEFADGTIWGLDEILSETTVEGDTGNNTLNGTGFDDNLLGGAGDDKLYGKDGDDTLSGGTGDDVLRGEVGNDTYIWSKGDGNDTVYDSGQSVYDVDRLILTDVMPDDVVLTRANGSNDLKLVTHSASGVDATNGGLQYEYYTGSWYSVADIPTTGAVGAGVRKDTNVRALDQFHGGNDDHFAVRMVGVVDITTAGTYTFTTGSDDGSALWINGTPVVDNDGRHRYKQESGSITLPPGQHTIEIVFFEGEGLDTLDVFVSGPDTSSVQSELFASGLLGDASDATHLLNVDSTTFPELTQQLNFLTIQDQFKSGGAGRGIEVIEFADGTIWGLDEILSRATVEGDAGNNTLNGTDFDDNLLGGAGVDKLYGKDGDDVIAGGTGDDLLYGGTGSHSDSNGNDTYVWSKGDGNDTIYDGGHSLTEIDRLVLTDVMPDDVKLERTNGSTHLTITILSTGEVITDQYQYHKTTEGYGIEVMEFADGTIWGVDEILSRTTVEGDAGNNTLNGTGFDDNLLGGDGDDTLYGKDGNDVITGGAGDDMLYGGATSSESTNGNDSYVWSKGDGNDTIYDAGRSVAEADRLVLTDVNPDDIVLTRANGSYDLIITVLSTSEVITDRHQYSSPSESGRGLEVIEFADGTIWGLDEILSRTTVEGDAGNNTLNGTGFDDNLLGGDGDDKLYGKAGDDVITGGKGDDLLVGGTTGDASQAGDGNDTYIWSKGDGNDTIRDVSNSLAEVDRLILTDVMPDDVKLERTSGSTSLTITILSTGEVITNLHKFYSAREANGIEVIEFADGTIWGLDEILAETTVEGDAGNNTLNGTGFDDNLLGGAGDDKLYGKDGDDTLTGGTGDDFLRGDAGNDTYVWSKGDGNDTINDGGASLAEVDRLTLTDVTPDDVKLTRANGSEHLTITILSTGEVITDQYSFHNTSRGYGFEVIEFADGTIWGLDEILAMTTVEGDAGNNTLNGAGFDDNLLGGAGDDKLYGKDGDDTLTGGTGDDFLRGDAGNDTYVWSKGDGNDTINDGGASLAEVDRLTLTDVTPDDVKLTRANGGEHLTITILSTGEVITDQYRYHNTSRGYGIEVIEFADGTIWALDEIMSQITTEGDAGNNTLNGTDFDDNLLGGAGDDTLDGGEGDDILDGGDGNDTIYGRSGNDTYVWSKGDGNDTVYDNSTSMSEVDRLILADVIPADVKLERTNGSTHLTITILSTGEVITDQYSFHNPAQGYGIDVIEFADGTIWGLDEIMSQTTTEGDAGNNTLNGTDFDDNLLGGAGDDTLDGGEGDDTLDGGDGNDTIYGRSGNDTYVWSKGDGNDTVYDNSTSMSEVDRLILADVIPADVKLERTNGSTHLTITILSTGEVITDQYSFHNPAQGYGIEVIEFADGTIWGLDEIMSQTTTEGDDGNNTLNGTDFDDNLLGGAGDDTLYGGAGSDKLDGGSGVDTLSGGSGNDVYIVDNANDRIVETTTGGTDKVISSIGLDMLGRNGAYTNVENAELAGTADINLFGSHGNNALTGNAGDNTLSGRDGHDHLLGHAGNDTLYGGIGNDRLDGGTGVDTLDGGAGNDVYIVDNANDRIVETTTGGIDKVISSIGLDMLGRNGAYTNVENAELAGTADINLFGSHGNNALTGNAGDNTLSGRNGNDTLDGGAGNDTLDGGAGNDTLTGGTGDDIFVLYEGSGEDVITDFNVAEDIVRFNDMDLSDLVITLNDSDTVITYGNGNILTLESVLATDLSEIEFERSDNGSTQRVRIDSDTSKTWETIVEYLNSDGEQYEERVNYDTGTQKRTVTDVDEAFNYTTYLEYRNAEGELYDKRINYDTGTQKRIVTDVDNSKNWETVIEYRNVDGELYDKRINYDTGIRKRTVTDVDNSKNWATVIEYRNEDGELYEKTVHYDDGVQKVTLFDVSESNSLNGSIHSDTIWGLEGDDHLLGLEGDDTLDGGEGDDILDGGDGNDTLSGRAGNDILYGRNWHDTLYGYEGNDMLYGGNGQDVVYGGEGNDLVYGGNGTDQLGGGDGDDRVYGGEGNDRLYGADGNDQLTGGYGDDIMTGGAGDDVFVLKEGAGSDQITDYSVAEDTVKFEGFTFTDLTITQNGDDTEIAYGNGNVVTLEDVLASDMVETEFQFS